MSKELQELTDGTYILKETGVENQFYFFRSNHQVLGNVGVIPVELLAKYYIEKSQCGKKQKTGYKCKIDFNISNCEISQDRTMIRITVSNNLRKKPNLHIVKNGENTRTSVAKSQLNFFKRATRKIFGKG